MTKTEIDREAALQWLAAWLGSDVIVSVGTLEGRRVLLKPMEGELKKVPERDGWFRVGSERTAFTVASDAVCSAFAPGDTIYFQLDGGALEVIRDTLLLQGSDEQIMVELRP
jgi:hypothetical protein